jgi:hypothetical protein
MINKQLVMDTLKKMLDSGMDEDVIESTFMDVGLTKEEIKQFIEEAKKEKLKEKETTEKITPKTVEEHFPEEEAQELKKTTETIALHESNALIENLSEKMDSIQRKLNILIQRDFNPMELNERLDLIESTVKDIKTELNDLKALNSALKEIMKKILETDREILTKQLKKQLKT